MSVLVVSTNNMVHVTHDGTRTRCGAPCEGWPTGETFTSEQVSRCFTCEEYGDLVVTTPGVEVRCAGCGQELEPFRHRFGHKHYGPRGDA